MSKTHAMIAVFVLLAVTSLTVVTPAHAFDGRQGNSVVIPAGQVVNDDLYVGASQFTLDGTVNGDVVAAGNMITINGTVNGDLIAAGQTIVINGTVTGATRIAGSVLFIGEHASLGRDFVGAGFSLETRPGSAIARDLIFAGGQILVSGDVTRNMLVATGGLQLAGSVGGDVHAEVGEADQNGSEAPAAVYSGQSTVPVPPVKPGLTIDPAAKIGGNLEYTQTTDLSFPAGVVAGKITRDTPPANQSRGTLARFERTPAERVGSWAFNSLRSLLTLLLVGLFLAWLIPAAVQKPQEKLEAKPLPSLAWGVVAIATYLFTMLVIFIGLILGAVIFGIVTLGSLSGTVVSLGLLALFGLSVGFGLVTSFLAKLVVASALGKWILGRLNPSLVTHRYWPMLIGVAVLVVVVALLSFPLALPGLGWLVGLGVVLAGLGAVWMWGREAWAKSRLTPAVPTPSA
jgi:cytoskeletal protein CcmA (bactofilin family)